MAANNKANKDSRIDLRVKSAQKDFLIHAASLRRMRLTTFVLASAFKAAEEAVNENIHFALSEKQWNSFCEALDKPAREIPKLKKLF